MGLFEEFDEYCFQEWVHGFFQGLAEFREGNHGIFGEARPERFDQFEDFGHDGWKIVVESAKHVFMVFDEPSAEI